MSIERLTGARKAAMLMVLIGDDASSEVFKHMNEDEVTSISKEISSIRNVPPETADELLEDFHNMSLAREYIAVGGFDYAKKVLIKSMGPESARKILDRLVKSLESTPSFSNLEKANPQQLSRFIQNEHPQTIALVLAHLNPTQASELLTSLPESLQSEVAMRMANLEQINPEVVKRISNVLEHKIEALGGGQVEEYGGVRAVAEMFNRMDRSAGRTVLEKIEVVDSDLANAIRDLMFVFDDILLLDDQAIVEILKRADKKTLALALKGTTEQLQQMFFRNMSQRAVEMMNEEMEYMGLVRVRDVKRAQNEIVEIVRQLEEEGVISIGGTGGEEYVV
jgi:flagellar motor switch protein FliG